MKIIIRINLFLSFYFWMSEVINERCFFDDCLNIFGLFFEDFWKVMCMFLLIVILVLVIRND